MLLKRVIYNAIMCSLLCGCIASPCPALKTYSKKDQIQIAKEKSQLPEESELNSVLEDWARYRKTCR